MFGGGEEGFGGGGGGGACLMGLISSQQSGESNGSNYPILYAQSSAWFGVVESKAACARFALNELGVGGARTVRAPIHSPS